MYDCQSLLSFIELELGFYLVGLGLLQVICLDRRLIALELVAHY